MKTALGTLARWTGLEAAMRFARARRNVTVVVYHNPDPDTLRSHLAWFSRRYSFTTMDAVADAMETGRWGDLPRYPLVITFDDGHRANAKLEPVLREFGVRPTIYLCSRIIGTHRPYWWQTPAAERLGVEALKRLPDRERRARLAGAGNDPERDGDDRQAMSWEEVRALTPICDFGAHTRNHPILIRCDDRQCADEIAYCKSEVEAFLQRPCQHFAYPNGDFGEREVAVLRQAGYRTARTIEPGWNGPDADPMRLKAFPVSDDVPVSWLAVQMTGIPAWLRGIRDARRSQDGGMPSGQPVPVA